MSRPQVTPDLSNEIAALLDRLTRSITTTSNIWNNKSSPEAVISGDTSPAVSRKLHKDEDDEDPGPVPYSTSKAAQWQARQTFRIIQDPIYGPPSYQPIIVRLCLIVFMVYFCILREENDLDDILRKGLFDHNPNMNEEELTYAIKKYDEVGVSSAELREKLRNLKESGSSSAK